VDEVEFVCQVAKVGNNLGLIIPKLLEGKFKHREHVLVHVRSYSKEEGLQEIGSLLDKTREERHEDKEAQTRNQ